MTDIAATRFLLRLPPGLQAALTQVASSAGLSLNQWCVQRLSAPGASAAGESGGAAAVARAAELVGGHLIGAVVYGSWVRGQASPQSDVDVLVIVDHRVRLSRDLYRRWDAAPVGWGDRRVDPHFAHLPQAPAGVGGAWAEAALDGVVMLERRGLVSQHLAAVRHEIAAGRLVRKIVHGQPYWTAAA
jgi:hypothetical protein